MVAHPDRREQTDSPEVMFLPLAASPGAAWRGLDAGVFARRLPDFVHQVLNRGRAGPTAVLELQTAAENGPVKWVVMEDLPDRETAFELVPAELDVEAVVSGQLDPVDGGLRVEFHVHRDDGDEADGTVTQKVGGTVPLLDPVPTLLRLARHLARVLDLPYREPPRGLLTGDGAAFRHFLQGLDNAMLLSGDLDIAVPDDREALIRPFADALALDPSFGLALRVANTTAALALDGRRLDREAVRRFLDRCYTASPFDGEACVAVAAQLTDMGDDQRAFAWLEHASRLDPPPPRGLESLGILMVRRGDVPGARELWQKGLAVDGHPDFFSHLAQLCFAEDREADGWELVLRGLRRLRERVVRAAEWDDDERGAGVLLECLQAVLTSRRPPRALASALRELCRLLDGEAQVHLGLCLLACGLPGEARAELQGGLRFPQLDLESRDRAVRALLQIDVPGFEKAFARAVEQAQRGRNPRRCLRDFQDWQRLQPEFWPALFFAAVAQRRLGETDDALDLLALALESSPGQPDVLLGMAELFAARQNGKRALELVDAALAERPAEARLHAAKLRYLQGLGRPDAARAWLARALADGVDAAELRRLSRARRLT
ncbi:MAG: tetratricopeptide repeat protein [Planctomycetes bacterium]|nr:tetratricopeptide repeat protein [Planctomycetota bacterium]